MYRQGNPASRPIIDRTKRTGKRMNAGKRLGLRTSYTTKQPRKYLGDGYKPRKVHGCNQIFKSCLLNQTSRRVSSTLHIFFLLLPSAHPFSFTLFALSPRFCSLGSSFSLRPSLSSFFFFFLFLLSLLPSS